MGGCLQFMALDATRLHPKIPSAQSQAQQAELPEEDIRAALALAARRSARARRARTCAARDSAGGLGLSGLGIGLSESRAGNSF